MRIAFMHRQLLGGGTEADLRRMTAGLSGRGHDVHVFCVRPAGAPQGVQVHRVPLLGAGRVARTWAFALLAPWLVSRDRFDLSIGFGRTLKQSVVRVGGGTHRTYLARMEASGLRARRRGPYHRLVLWIERRAFAAGPRVLAVSARVRDEVTRDYAVPADRVRVLYNGVDLDRFHPAHRSTAGAAVRASFGFAPSERVCLGIGTGFARKGFDLLLRLWADGAPHGARLVIVGDDERLGQWRARATSIPGVLFTGPRPDVDALLAAADVLCVPSRQEAFGNVVLEACASGVPVVTSSRVGAAELLDGPLSDLVVESPEPPDDFRTALEAALGPRHAEFAAAARRCAEAYPWGTHLDRLETFLGEAVRG